MHPEATKSLGQAQGSEAPWFLNMLDLSRFLGSAHLEVVEEACIHEFPFWTLTLGLLVCVGFLKAVELSFTEVFANIFKGRLPSWGLALYWFTSESLHVLAQCIQLRP